MKTYFGFWKQILNMKDSIIEMQDILKLYLLLVDMIQWKLLNVITLVQRQSDNLDQIICTEFYQEWFGTWPIWSHCLDNKIISDPIKQLSQYWNILNGKSGKSAQYGSANVSESGESAQHGSAQAGMIR